MFRNYFKAAFRNMRRNRLFTGLNIFGLATGLACGILIFLWVKDEFSFDRFNPGADKIFRLVGQVKDIETANVPAAFARVIGNQIPGIKNATRFTLLQKIITVGKRKFDEKHMFYVDSNFLRIFSYPLLRGNPASVFREPNCAAITEATAIKYFGSVDQAIGKSIYIDNDIQGTTMQVTGVLKNIPANSHLQFDLLLTIDNWDRQIDQTQTWRFFDSYIYFQLADEVNPNPERIRAIEKQISSIRNKAIINTQAVPASFVAQPLTKIHLYSHFRNDVDGQGNIQYVRIFILVAGFIIFIACINFMNLATALSGIRAKEVGLRKTIGALRFQLVLQFIGESLLLSFLSLGLALLLVYAALPSFNQLASKSISMSLLDIRMLGEILALTLAVGLQAGSYPAIYIASFNIIKALKGGQIDNGQGSIFRNSLVVLQFSISVILMISTLVIYDQLHFLHNRDIGFHRENLLYVPMPEVGDLKNNADAIKSALTQSIKTSDFTITSDLPTDMNGYSPLTWRGMENGSLVISQRLNVDENFIQTFGMKMVAGRFYSGDFKGNDSEYVVNETAVKAMHMDPTMAVGKAITFRGQEGEIIGVVKDFNFRPVYQPIEPLVMRHRASGDFLVIRTAAGAIQETLATVQNCFQRVYGNNPFSYGFIDQDLDHLYRSEIRMGSLFNIFSVLSIVISCLGLFGLVTFATQRRKKEIGVRKVLGAGEAGIVVLLAKEFLKLVFVSLLIAYPVSWYAMHQWLQGFVYKTNINGWVFFAAGMMALPIALITLSYQTIKAAMANPVHSLRSE